jgi:hypothetical protein
MTMRRRQPHRRATPTVAAARHAATHRPPLPPGQLQAMVLTHLRAHPAVDFSPSGLANVLDRPTSRGAVINACRHWSRSGRPSVPSTHRCLLVSKRECLLFR